MPEAPIAPEKPQRLRVDNNIAKGMGRWAMENTEQPRDEIQKLLLNPPSLLSNRYREFVEAMKTDGIQRMNNVLTGLTESRKVEMESYGPHAGPGQKFLFIGDNPLPPKPGIYPIDNKDRFTHALYHNLLGVPVAGLAGFSELMMLSSNEQIKKWASELNQQANAITQSLGVLKDYNPQTNIGQIVVGNDGRCLFMLVPKERKSEEATT